MDEGKSNQMREEILRRHQDYGFVGYAVAHPQTLSLVYSRLYW